MIATICLLRGVNLGGHKTIKMDEFREMLSSPPLSFLDVRTLIQSGNAVFRSRKPVDAAKIAAAIEKRFGFHSDVILRTAAELEATIARNPFPERAASDPAKLTVTFLSKDWGPEAAARVAAFDTAGEEMRLIGAELYTYFHNGQGKTKLKFSALAKAVGEAGTARNWNTVLKLAAMARE